MVSSLSTSTNNVYSIMDHSNAAMSNSDPNKAASIGKDMQRGVQETLDALQKGNNENYRQTLRKIDILV